MVFLFSTKCFLFIYLYIDLLKLTAYKLFENSDADLSWLLFFNEANLLKPFLAVYYITRYIKFPVESAYTEANF